MYISKEFFEVLKSETEVDMVYSNIKGNGDDNDNYDNNNYNNNHHHNNNNNNGHSVA
jgi:hypothetical protein